MQSGARPGTECIITMLHQDKKSLPSSTETTFISTNLTNCPNLNPLSLPFSHSTSNLTDTANVYLTQPSMWLDAHILLAITLVHRRFWYKSPSNSNTVGPGGSSNLDIWIACPEIATYKTISYHPGVQCGQPENKVNQRWPAEVYSYVIVEGLKKGSLGVSKLNKPRWIEFFRDSYQGSLLLQCSLW